MWRALESGYGYFQEVGKDKGPYSRKRKFLENFFPKPPKPRMCRKGTTEAFGTSLWTTPRTNFFSKIFLL